MTTIQAIDVLMGLEQSLDDYCELNDEGRTAFGMAILALELFGNSEQLPSAQPGIAEKLYLCKCYVTDEEGLQHEVIHTGDIRRITGWEI